jgi:hypothetical protein
MSPANGVLPVPRSHPDWPAFWTGGLGQERHHRRGRSDQTTVANSLDNAYRVVEVGSGTTTLSGLTVHGALDIPVLVYGTGHVVTQNVDLDGGACSLTVLAGQADLTDSVSRDSGGGPRSRRGQSAEPSKGPSRFWADVSR